MTLFVCDKAAYDKLVNAKIAAKLREKEYDSKRKKFIDDLARREKEALRNQKNMHERNFEVFLVCYLICFYCNTCHIFTERIGAFEK